MNDAHLHFLKPFLDFDGVFDDDLYFGNAFGRLVVLRPILSRSVVDGLKRAGVCGEGGFEVLAVDDGGFGFGLPDQQYLAVLA